MGLIPDLGNSAYLKMQPKKKKKSKYCSLQPQPGFPCGSAGKESTCNAETWVQSLGWEDPLEKGKATHSSILA